MPPEIARLAESILSNPVRIAVNPVASTVDRVDQRVMFVERTHKRPLLSQLLKDPTVSRALVFTRTKHGANRVAEELARSGVQADAIHGNKSQPARTRALERFRTGAGRVLVATDIAARGIDVDGITHVINYDLPNVPESYVHRIGRTARAGRSGVAISFCDGEERAYLRDIEALIKIRIPVIADHPWHSASAAPQTKTPDRRTKPRANNGRGRRGGPRPGAAPALS
jgi:ATP-dependent RNA helicase RhlE